MSRPQHMEAVLWNYIENTCSSREKSNVQMLLAESLEWKNKYNELMKFHCMIKESLRLEEPSPNFLQNVMVKIADYK
jgi:hypothetical protein